MKRFLILLLAAAMLIPCGLCEEEYDVAAVVETLKTCWRDEVYGFAEDASGYLEIKNTRVVVICDAPKAGEESAQAHADECFGNVDYIVEFMLYSDLMGAAPYYQDAGAWDCVAVYEDGSMEVLMENLFSHYTSRTYSLDFSGIIADVVDLNQDYNAVYHLFGE